MSPFRRPERREGPLSLFGETLRAGASLRPAPPEMTEADARALTQRVIAMATADGVRVNINASWQGNSRFATSEITTSGGVTDTTVNVSVTVGKRRAAAATNVLDDASLKRTVELAERLARLSPDDAELMPELGPQQYAKVEAFSDSTASLAPDARAKAVQALMQAARAEKGSAGELAIAGFLEAQAGATAVATKSGLFAFHRSTQVSLSCTVRTPDGTGSGWASGGARDWSQLDAAALGRTAARKAVMSRNPQAIEPGMYTVVLEPQAVADMIPSLTGSLNARQADEGRSAFSKKGGGTRVGETIADARITLLSDPADGELLTTPFDNEGLPVPRRVWVENGVLKELSYSRYWAQKQGKDATGGGGGGGGGGFGGVPGGLRMVGGSMSTEELIAGTERGVLVTHMFYIRPLDPRTVLLTGLTRDGTFLIEKGKVTRALKNFRWNESPLLMLNRVDEIGRAERTARGQVMPALKIRDFNFTSLSDAV